MIVPEKWSEVIENCTNNRRDDGDVWNSAVDHLSLSEESEAEKS